MTQPETHESLKERVLAREKALMAMLDEKKDDLAETMAADRVKIAEELKELGTKIHMGWDNMSEHVKTALHEWLERTEEFIHKHPKS
jgi:hypothetical protein